MCTGFPQGCPNVIPKVIHRLCKTCGKRVFALLDVGEQNGGDVKLLGVECKVRRGATNLQGGVHWDAVCGIIVRGGGMDVTQNAKLIFEQYQVRKTRAQKTAFLE